MSLRADAPVFVPHSRYSNAEQSTLRKQTSRHPTEAGRGDASRRKRCYRKPPSSHRPKPYAEQSRRSRRRVSRQQRLREEERGTGSSTVETESTLEDLFPRLLTVESPHASSSALEASPWGQAERLRESLATENNKQVEETPAEAPLLAPGLERLQRPQKNMAQTKTLQLSDSPNSSTPPPVLLGTRRNVSKLRDRWWELLREHQQHLPEEQPVSTEEEIDNESSSDDDEEESFVDYQYHRTLQEAPKEVVLEAVYDTTAFPLHEAIQRNDEMALEALLRKRTTSLDHQPDQMTPTQLAVHLDRPRLLRILLRHNCEWTDNNHLAPLLMAVNHCREECLQVFLAQNSAPVTTLLSTRDNRGNHALHLACQSGNLPTWQLLLDYCGRGQSTSKLFLARNDRGQTPLHVACQLGHVNFVEVILATLSLPLLSKLLLVQDDNEQPPLLAAVASGSTDTVMSLLMWRGNNHQSVRNQKAPCPLVHAVRQHDREMVLLLLEFNDPSGAGYDLVYALHTAVEETRLRDETMIDILRVLVEAGANPCAPGADELLTMSALAKAASKHNAKAVACLIDSYDNYLLRIHSERRRDPVLQKQPESFLQAWSRERAQSGRLPCAMP